MQRGCVCPLHHCFPPSFNLPLEIVVVVIIIIILNNNNDNRAACPCTRVGPRCCSTRLGRWGAGSGALPQPGRTPPSSAASHAWHGRAGGWSRGNGSWDWYPSKTGGSPRSSPLPAPHPGGRPRDALGGTSRLLPAKRIGFRAVCEKAPAEPIPAAISDNKALY